MILNTIADLQALTTTPSDNHANVLGYNTPADGGGGDFYWDATSTATANSGTVFECGATIPSLGPIPATGKWLRYYSESVNLKWFGATGDGSTNDSPAFQSMIDFCEQNGVKDAIIPYGEFYLEQSVHIKIGGIKFVGQGTMLREDSSWNDMKLGGNIINPLLGFSVYTDYDYSDDIAYKGATLVVENNISGIVYDPSVCDSVYWRGVAFRSKDDRTNGNTYAIDFRSVCTGPTWPFNIHECYFRGFNRVFNFECESDLLYDIASINITHSAFKLNDEVVYQGFKAGTDSRYVCWGFNFQNNKCHNNSRVIYGCFGKDMVTISDNNLEGNVVYADNSYPPYVVDIAIGNCSVSFHGNHFEGMVSDCVSINSIYNGTLDYVDIYGNNFDGLLLTQPQFKPYTLNGCIIKINEPTPIHVHACEIIENGNSNIYMTDYARENGTIIKFTNQQLLSTNFVHGIHSYSLIRSSSSDSKAFLENGEQWVRTSRNGFGIENEHSFVGDVQYCIASYRIKNNSTNTFSASAFCTFTKDGVVLNPPPNYQYVTGSLYLSYGESIVVCIFPSEGLFTTSSNNKIAIGLAHSGLSIDLADAEICASMLMYTTKESNPQIIPAFESSNIVDENNGTFIKGQTWFNGTTLRTAIDSGTTTNNPSFTSTSFTISAIDDNKILLSDPYFYTQGQYIVISGNIYRILELRDGWATLDSPYTGSTGVPVTFHAPMFSDVAPAETEPLYTSDKEKIVSGDNNTKTSQVSNFNTALPTGIYNGYNATGGANGDWELLMHMRHVVTSNNFGADVISTMGTTGTPYLGWREISNGNYGTWHKIWTSLDFDTTSFIQNQNASAQTANAWISGNFITEGKIGIGTSAPIGSLEISGTGGVVLSILRNSTATGYSDLRIMNDLNSTAHMLALGYTGSSYSSSYWIGGISGEVGAIGTIGNYPFEIGTNNTSRISVLANGNVGINSTTPAQSLDVTGTIRQSNATSAILKANSSGDIVAAVAGTDYLNPNDFESGTYTPTVTGAETYTPSTFIYTRIGNVVHVTGNVAVAGPTGGSYEFFIDLPISTNVTSIEDVSGVVSGKFELSSPVSMINFVEGDTSGNTARTSFSSNDDAKVYVQFDYIIQ